MGVLFSAIWKRLFKQEEEFKIIIIGLHNVGKTTILYRLSLGQVIQTRPTIGSNVEEVKNKNVKFQVWDLGGQDSLRDAWNTYYQNTHAVIYAVDSSDETNSELAKMELFNMLLHDDLKEAVILVFANKQDLPTSKSADEIAERFGLSDIRTHEWSIQPCCALTGEGLKEGLEWITNKLLTKLKKSNPKTTKSLPIHITKLPKKEFTNKSHSKEINTNPENYEETKTPN